MTTIALESESIGGILTWKPSTPKEAGEQIEKLIVLLRAAETSEKVSITITEED